MQAVEFEATITNGVLHIPKQYKELDVLFGNSHNTVQVTMALATQTDEMMDDGIL